MIRFSTHVQKKIKLKKKCVKCFKLNHISTQANASCKNEKFMFVKEIQAKLSTINLDWNDQYEKNQNETLNVDQDYMSSENEFNQKN